MAVIPYGCSGQRPARARPGRFGGAGVAAMAASSAAASTSCGRGSAAAGTAGGDGAGTVVTVSVTTRAASGALSDGGYRATGTPRLPRLASGRPSGAPRPDERPHHHAAGSAPRHTRPRPQSLQGTAGLVRAVSHHGRVVLAVGPSRTPSLSDTMLTIL